MAETAHVPQAKPHLIPLLARVGAGEDIAIARTGGRRRGTLAFKSEPPGPGVRPARDSEQVLCDLVASFRGSSSDPPPRNLGPPLWLADRRLAAEAGDPSLRPGSRAAITGGGSRRSDAGDRR